MNKNKEKKIRGNINLFDFLFILLIIVLVFAAYYRYGLSKDKEVFKTDKKIIYTAKVENIKKDIIENISMDDLIFKETTVENEYRKIGKITNIDIEPYKEIEYNLDGTINNIEVPECYNIILTIKEEGKISGGTYYSSTNEGLYSNETVSANTKYAKFEMKIQSIEEEK